MCKFVTDNSIARTKTDGMSEIEGILPPMSVELPQWAEGWRVKSIKVVKTLSLRVRIQEGKKKAVIKLIESPHYKCMKLYHENGDMTYASKASGYATYVKEYMKDPEAKVNQFLKLYLTIQNVGYLCSEYHLRPILLFRRYPWSPLCVFDGLHRVAVLGALECENVTVGIIGRAWSLRRIFRSLFSRLWNV